MVEITVKVPALEKLLDYAASGIGAVAGPMLAPWKAHKEAKARHIEATAQADSLRLIAEAQAKARRSLVAPDGAVSGILEIRPDDIEQRIEFQERKRQANIVSVIRDAAEELGDKEIPDHEPDHDWTARFFDCVQDVSSEDMRGLWAKILSGEVESPGRTSLRTLDILRNMTARDARLFKEVCDLVIDDYYIFCPDEYRKNHDVLMYGKIIHLNNCGLLNEGPFLSRNIEFTGSEKFIDLLYQDYILRISPTKKLTTLSMPIVLLTSSGGEICKILDCSIQFEYLQFIAKFLRANNCDLSYARVVERLTGGSLLLTLFTLIEPDAIQSGVDMP